MIWQQEFVLRALERCGKARSALGDAIIADLAAKQSAGLGFGVLQAMTAPGW
jgi:hypothetical protein